MFGLLAYLMICCLSLLSFERHSRDHQVAGKVKLLFIDSSSKMAIQWFNKTIVCGTTAVAALFYCVVILRNRKENKEIDKPGDNIAFEIKIINPHSPNIHNGKQGFVKNSANLNNETLTSKEQVIFHFKTECSQNKLQSKQNVSTGSVQPLRNKKLFSMQSKTEKGCNSIILNSARFLTHDESNERIIPNNIALSYESNAQDNLNHSLIIRIGNLRNSTNNRVQIKIFNKPIKQSMLDIFSTFANYSTSNRSVNQTMINQNENQEIGIMISPLNSWHIVNSFITFYGNQLTVSTSNKQHIKKIEKNDITVIINAPV
ncbi:uncharacterized protein LOC115232804 [Formica exsecta]|uniref:uncharacterized protein LOC115232804 n=1 Tax=Formica exsecta TaxID=72781 RepID=UPI00114298FF|nr:uncharacterized protein LOC115232804 [Formica exsecta]